MRHLMFAAALIVVVVWQAGCKPTPRAKAAAASPAGQANATNAANAATPAAAESKRAPAAAPAKGAATPGKAAFFAANAEVEKISHSMYDLLVAVTDEKSAREAAEKLPALTRRWEPAQKTATLLYLGLSKEQQDEALAEMQQQGIEKMKRGEIPKKPAIRLMIDLAKGPYRPILHDAIVQFRDIYLAQHSIYAPVRSREYLAKELGAAGSPLAD